ncbi:type I restriction-modification system endonuclease [Hyphomicrobium sp. MC8b]|uniref:type I restriction-modification system endonuclease n=1 Tax=Hyphomicrobium sp. MC8b TaxID=300273 RepID=UPI003919CBBD
MYSSKNFGFLIVDDERLVDLGAFAERYFRDDPSTAIFKLRQFAELLAKLVAAHHATYQGERETFEEVLRRLSYDRIITKEVADVFHVLRKLGNSAAHEGKGNHSDALSALKFARQLGVWFHRTYSKEANFKSGPFVPPPEPEDATAALNEEIENLRRKVLESEDAAARAQREAEEHARARETVEQRLEREAEERAVWEKLAEESESAKNEIAARLAAIQSEAEKAPRSEATEFIERGEAASEKLELDEAATRALIDQQLRDAGWEADTNLLRYSEGTRPAKGKNLAIAEWPTKSGRADYALFVGTTLVGMVEAKRKRKNVSAAIDQAERYSVTVQETDKFTFAGGPWGDHKAPFVFAANGRSYLKQIETESGIWFRDTRRAANHRRALVDWHTPGGLTGLLEIDQDAATEHLKSVDFNFGFPLRDYQKRAIQAVEAALEKDSRSMLVAMATGTGKTKLAIAMLYRLLTAKRFRRICFVVDRSALGQQTADEFTTTKVVGANAFADIFGLKGLEQVKPEDETKVHICTIQGLLKRVLYTADASEAPPVDQYDLVVIDECHRGYLLDREMSDAELSFRGEEDYISKYRRVLEYFDAVKIGLTATPALHTTEIFGEPIFKYSYREAVVEGYLIDHEPPVQIETELARSGIGFSEGEQVEFLVPSTGEISTAKLPDDLGFEVEQFNRKVITEPFNKAVAEELAKHIDPALPGKTLIFAATDAHADIVVKAVKDAFAKAYGDIDDASVRKITGSVDKVKSLIRSFRNDAEPKIAVTVDLLTTGIDVPSITNLVFIRRVNSRILYDQMIGRATRLCPEIGKEVFRIFDAVDLYRNLKNVTEMKPVVVDPSISFEKLVKELVSVADPKHREIIRDQLAVKLRRRLKKLAPDQRQHFEAQAGETPEDTLKRVLQSDSGELAKWFSVRPGVAPLLDWKSDAGTPIAIPISHHDDQVVAVTRGYGKDANGNDINRPEDYLDGFTAFVKDPANLNAIAALTVVLQRPRDLTRADLKALRLALDQKGFTEVNLRRAWSDAKNQDIAASIIGFVRQAALGDALIPYADRVRAAMQKVLASRPWSDPQKKWLRRIGEQVEKEIVVDRAALDAEPFSADGGFSRLNKVFNGELEAVLAGINEAMWRKAS